MTKLDFDGGFVVITAGKHKGKVGVWDDDGPEAIVYTGDFMDGECVSVRYSSIRQASKDEASKFVEEAPYWKNCFDHMFSGYPSINTTISLV